MNAPRQPLVSVGMPTYRRPEGLRRALDCARRQTWPNLEIIVSQNGGADEQAYAFMDEYQAADERIRFVRQEENIGALSNFKYVLTAARGEYFIWFADDDLCEDDYIERLVAVLEQHPQVVVSCSDIRVIDDADREVRVEHLQTLYGDGKWPDTRRLFFQYPVSNVFYAIYGMYRTATLRAGQHRIVPGWKGHNTNTEIPLLAWLATIGEIRAIRVAPKLYRIHPQSVYSREAEGLSVFTAIMIKVHIRGQLLSIIFRSGLPAGEKLALLASALLPRFGRLWARWTA